MKTSSISSTNRAEKARFGFVDGHWVPANEAARLYEAAQRAAAAMTASELDRQLTEELRRPGRGLQVRELCAQNIAHAASADGQRETTDFHAKEEVRREAANAAKAANAKAKAEAAGRRAIRDGENPDEKAALLERSGFVAGETTPRGGRVFRHSTGVEVEVYGAAVDPAERATRKAMGAIGRVTREGGDLEAKAAAVLALHGWCREGRMLVHETGATVELRLERKAPAPAPATPTGPRHNRSSGKPRISGSLYRELKEAGKLVHSSGKKKTPEGKKSEKSKKEGKWK